MWSQAVSFSLAASALLQTALAAPGPSRGNLPPRPVIVPSPYNVAQSIPESPARDANRYCYVKPTCTQDDAVRIREAFDDCNDGGTVVLDRKYIIKSPLDLTWLKAIDVIITGEITFRDDDVYYWDKNSFKLPFQNMSAFWLWGGEDVNIWGDLSNGKSLIDGRGESYWAEGATNKVLRRPTLFTTDGMKGLTMSNLRMRNAPMWFNMIANSTDVLISDLHITAKAERGTKIANSDGWDTYRSNRVVIQNSVIDNTDDCVSFKPNSTDVVIQNLVCNGSHGISVGSLGQYKGETDIVEDLYVYNISMSNASDGARIKVWPGIESAFQADLNGGGGLGRVRNVTYDTFYHQNNDNAITITQCYGQSNQTLCNLHPSNLTIEDIYMTNFWGTVSKKFDPRAGSLVCSADDRCSNIHADDIRVTVPSGKKVVYACDKVQRNLLDFNCVDPGTERDNTNG